MLEVWFLVFLRSQTDTIFVTAMKGNRYSTGWDWYRQTFWWRTGGMATYCVNDVPSFAREWFVIDGWDTCEGGLVIKRVKKCEAKKWMKTFGGFVLNHLLYSARLAALRCIFCFERSFAVAFFSKPHHLTSPPLLWASFVYYF